MQSPARQSTIDGGRVERTIHSRHQVERSSTRFHATTSHEPDDILSEIEEVHGRSKFYALTSGGKDSIAVLHWLAEKGRLEQAVHIKTGVGFRATTDFITDYCNDMGWPLRIIEPNPKFAYVSFVLEYGFPGPAYHRLIMGKLKYKTMRDFAYSVDKKNHCLITGIRKWESGRRMGNYPLPIQNHSGLWFGCPFFYKSKNDVMRYAAEYDLRITPVHKYLGFSGECMCGAFQGLPQKELIRKHDPDLAAFIDWLEDAIQRWGTPHAKKYPKWGDAPRISDLEAQTTIGSFLEANPDLAPVNELESYICGESCEPMYGTLSH